MNEAIKLAIEKGGYLNDHTKLGGDYRGASSDAMRVIEKAYAWRNSRILLDPDFWQALGKALGWNEDIIQQRIHASTKQVVMIQYAGWRFHWLSFIDWIADGKDVDDFFKELLINT
jgi:hypothetical protein